MKKRVVVFGAGGHGRVLADVLERSDKYMLAGFLDDSESLTGMDINGHPVLGRFDDFEELANRMNIVAAVIGVGYPAMKLRRDISDRILLSGVSLANSIHCQANISAHAVIGQGVFIGGFSVVGPNANIGSLTVIYDGCTVGHDCTVCENAYLSPGVHLAGRAMVGDGAFLGTGVSVVPDVNIGARSVVGAGAAVVKDVAADTTVAGVPAVVLTRCDREKK